MTEDEARRVLLLRAAETGPEHALWTAEDRAWATRLALQDGGAGAAPERFVAGRARHALQRLLPRDPAARRWLEQRAWRAGWVPLVALAAFIAGAAVDHIGAPQRVDLLAPPVWALVAWNLAVYLTLLLPGSGAWLRRALAPHWLAANEGPAALWARHAAPLVLARTALLLHVAAGALALGLVAGLYLRGLVLDYRAGWQSTFLDAPTVQALLQAGLAPAAALTGIALPDVAPLRLQPGQAASGPAAPWIHLYAALLALAVLLPRALLALAAALRAWRLSRRFPLVLEGDPYFDRLLREHQGRAARVQVLPHGAPASAQAALGLQALVAAAWGADAVLRIAAPLPYGQEAAPPPPEPGTTLRVALFDLGSTPEAEVHGRLLDALKATGPCAAVVDGSAFGRRFAALPERVAERRRAWQALADAHGVRLLAADLDAPDAAAARAWAA